MDNFDGEASAKRTAAAAADRLVFDSDLSSTPLDGIRCGVVFVHAFWAVSSVRTLRCFAETLVRVDPERHLAFIVCDIDKIEHLHGSLYGGDVTNGNGDILWIAKGAVRARHNTTHQCDFDTATRSLLLEC